MKYCIYDGDDRIEFVLDAAASKGIVRVAQKVAVDFERVTGIRPEIRRVESIIGLESEKDADHKSIIMFDINEGSFAQQYGQSVEEISGVIKSLSGRRECFAFAETGDNLVIAGSDRLGTIYGMFELSKMMGVSPLVYWADAAVEKKERVELDIALPFVSKEPSVKFRGYFINDEWPCFGNWTTDHFGGFTAEMYDHVFEFLLRMKGNYLWPAMWSSSFAWDGPGLASYELADEYGIYIGNSHHEPCLRAGEEWTKVNRDDPSYGGAWSVLTNYDGVVRFWRESMEERGRFNSLVTVGMRGERDSTILGENATLADNINVVKTAIKAQKEIISEQEKKLNKTFPKMLALYKEVEPFYFGDETTPGLSDWDGLDDVILMLCEDNHNYTRTLADPAISKHKGGLGMYYHVDYHGGPVSYEWLNSTPLSVIWEQMTQAYEFGVKDLWILNVGDVKFNEFPLTYFMELAYDFEKWGSPAPNITDEYTLGLLKSFFGGVIDNRQITKAATILTETVRLASLRRPEALTPDTYDLHNGEASGILKRVDILEAAAEQLYEVIEAEEIKRAAESNAGGTGRYSTEKFGKSDKYRAGGASASKAKKDGALTGTGKDITAMDAENSALAAYYSLIYFPAKAMINHIRLNIFAGLNHMYARENRKVANDYADRVEACIRMNKELNEEFAAFKGGKWKGMELEAHIGFTKWNDDGCRYPVIARVIPVDKPRLQVVGPYSERIYDKVYGAPMRLIVDDFRYPGNKETTLSLCNVGIGEVGTKIIVPECKWLRVEPVGGTMKAALKQGEERFKPDQGLRDEYFETRGETVIEGSIENEQDIRLIFDRDAFEKEMRGRVNTGAKDGAADSSGNVSGNEKNVVSLIFRITGSEGTAVEVEVRAAAAEDAGKAFRTGLFGFDIPADRFCTKETPEGSDILVLDDYGRNGTAVKALPVTKTYERGTEPVTEYSFICEDDGEYEVALHLAPENPPVRGSLLHYGFAAGDASMEYFPSVSADYKGGENSCREWTKAAVLRERVMTHKVQLKKGEIKVRFGFCEPGIVLERIKIHRV